MIKLIKKWQEKRRRKRILKIIKDAKQCFVEGRARIKAFDKLIEIYER